MNLFSRSSVPLRTSRENGGCGKIRPEIVFEICSVPEALIGENGVPVVPVPFEEQPSIISAGK
jgi:hypothetical protein